MEKEKSKMEQIIDNGYDFILELQAKYNETKKVEPDAQQMLQCNLAILNTISDVYIKQQESKHLIELKNQQFELEKQVKLLK